MPPEFERRLSASYGSLSQRLQQAGDYLAQNPLDGATRSLRAVAQESGIAPATFSRLARALEFRDFEELREAMRKQIGRRVSDFADRADHLRSQKGTAPDSFLAEAHMRTSENIGTLVANIDSTQLEATAERLSKARNVVLVGGLGSTGIAEYASYMGGFLGPNWHQAGRMGTSLGSAISDLSEDDALIVITKAPYATLSLRAAAEARAKGAYVVVISASHSCPAFAHSDSSFIVPSEGQNFFSSYVATLFLLETLVALVARLSGPEVADRIAQIEGQSRILGEVVE